MTEPDIKTDEHVCTPVLVSGDAGKNVQIKSFFRSIGTLYDFFVSRRVLLFAMTFIIIIGAAFILRNIRMNEDIAPLLPDGESEAARDFALLQKTPFADKVLINLKAGQSTSRESLIETTDRL